MIALIWLTDRGILTALWSADPGDVGLTEITLSRPATAPISIGMLGTSLTAAADWPIRITDALDNCRTGPVRLVMLARPGATSRWGQSRLAHAVAEGELPDLLLIEFSINDADLRIGLTRSESATHHDTILQQAAAAGIPVILMTMNPAWGRAARRRPGQSGFRALYRDRVRPGQVALLDTVPDWRALPSAERAAALPDGLHPTAAAVTRVFEPRLFTALSPLLCDPE